MIERRNNSSASRAQIENEVNAERERISGTIDALREALSVERLSDQVLKSLLRNPEGLASEIMNAVRKNPVAASVTGAGMVWLFAGTRLQSRAAEALGLAGESAGQKLGDAAEATGAALGGVAEEAGKWTSDKVRHATGEANSLFSQQPVLVGLAALAAGVALGVMYPAAEETTHRRKSAKRSSASARKSRARKGRRNRTAGTRNAASRSKARANGASSAGGAKAVSRRNTPVTTSVH